MTFSAQQERKHKIVGECEEGSSQVNLATPLFDCSLPSIRTSIAGISNAKYEQLTDGSKEIYKQVLRIFERHKLEYFLFAGAIVGYVRNGRMPPWNDDLDVIIFEDQIKLFETVVLPLLRDCGSFVGLWRHPILAEDITSSRCSRTRVVGTLPSNSQTECAL